MQFEPVEIPDFNDYIIGLEKIIGQYEELIVNKIRSAGIGSFKMIVSELETIDVVRCFFAILFLARDEKVELEQLENDINISLVKEKFTT